MIQVQPQPQITTSEPHPKTSFGMRLFKSKTRTDRQGSLDSNITLTNGIEHHDDPKRRKSSIGKLLKKKSAVVEVQNKPVAIVPPKQESLRSTSPSRPVNKLKKSNSNFPVIDISQTYQRDKQTGEQVIDHTDLLHSLVHQESADSVPRLKQFKNSTTQSLQTGEELLSKLPTKLWLSIFEDLTPADEASLSLTCKALRHHLVSSEAALELPENEDERVNFLLRLDAELPNHLFCFACKRYHLRLNPRKESLKPTNVANPIFTCPHAQALDKRVSRVRITSNRTLPFTFAQLILRAHQHSPDHGIAIDDLSRRWRDRDGVWSHQTRYTIVNDHLLVRVISTAFVAPGLPPAGVRNLLYNPHEEFHPYFSTCPHWRDGELMPNVKCAISHIPKPIEGSGIDRLGKDIRARIASPQSPIVTLCTNCRPMRRCPDCPSEYLCEIKMAEDRNESDPRKLFKQAVVVTRWSDLGDASGPIKSREWAAVSGQLEGFDSFAVLGKRAISGVFESQFNVDLIPGQRILNMNPKGERLGEEGHDWY